MRRSLLDDELSLLWKIAVHIVTEVDMEWGDTMTWEDQYLDLRFRYKSSTGVFWYLTGTRWATQIEGIKSGTVRALDEKSFSDDLLKMRLLID